MCELCLNQVCDLAQIRDMLIKVIKSVKFKEARIAKKNNYNALIRNFFSQVSLDRCFGCES